MDKEFLELDVLNALYELKQKEIRINRDILKASKIVDKKSHIRESIRLFTEYKEIENTNAYEKFLDTIESIKNAYKLLSMDFGGRKDQPKKKNKKNDDTTQSNCSETYKFMDLLKASLDNTHGETKSSRSDGKPPFVEDETMFRIEHELTKILDDAEKLDEKRSQGKKTNFVAFSSLVLCLQHAELRFEYDKINNFFNIFFMKIIFAIFFVISHRGQN